VSECECVRAHTYT